MSITIPIWLTPAIIVVPAIVLITIISIIIHRKPTTSCYAKDFISLWAPLVVIFLLIGGTIFCGEEYNKQHITTLDKPWQEFLNDCLVNKDKLSQSELVIYVDNYIDKHVLTKLSMDDYNFIRNQIGNEPGLVIFKQKVIQNNP